MPLTFGISYENLSQALKDKMKFYNQNHKLKNFSKSRSGFVTIFFMYNNITKEDLKFSDNLRSRVVVNIKGKQWVGFF